MLAKTAYKQVGGYGALLDIGSPDPASWVCKISGGHARRDLCAPQNLRMPRRFKARLLLRSVL